MSGNSAAQHQAPTRPTPQAEIPPVGLRSQPHSVVEAAIVASAAAGGSIPNSRYRPASRAPGSRQAARQWCGRQPRSGQSMASRGRRPTPGAPSKGSVQQSPSSNGLSSSPEAPKADTVAEQIAAIMMHDCKSIDDMRRVFPRRGINDAHADCICQLFVRFTAGCFSGVQQFAAGCRYDVAMFG